MSGPEQLIPIPWSVPEFDGGSVNPGSLKDVLQNLQRQILNISTGGGIPPVLSGSAGWVIPSGLVYNDSSASTRAANTAYLNAVIVETGNLHLNHGVSTAGFPWWKIKLDGSGTLFLDTGITIDCSRIGGFDGNGCVLDFANLPINNFAIKITGIITVSDNTFLQMINFICENFQLAGPGSGVTGTIGIWSTASPRITFQNIIIGNSGGSRSFATGILNANGYMVKFLNGQISSCAIAIEATGFGERLAVANWTFSANGMDIRSNLSSSDFNDWGFENCSFDHVGGAGGGIWDQAAFSVAYIKFVACHFEVSRTSLLYMFDFSGGVANINFFGGMIWDTSTNESITLDRWPMFSVYQSTVVNFYGVGLSNLDNQWVDGTEAGGGVLAVGDGRLNFQNTTFFPTAFPPEKTRVASLICNPYAPGVAGHPTNIENLSSALDFESTDPQTFAGACWVDGALNWTGRLLGVNGTVCTQNTNPTFVHDGTASLKLTKTGNAGQTARLFVPVRIRPGCTFSYHAWIYNDFTGVNRDCAIICYFVNMTYDENGLPSIVQTTRNISPGALDWPVVIVPFDAGTLWQSAEQVPINVFAPAWATHGIIEFIIRSDAGDYYFDSIFASTW